MQSLVEKGFLGAKASRRRCRCKQRGHLGCRSEQGRLGEQRLAERKRLWCLGYWGGVMQLRAKRGAGVQLLHRNPHPHNDYGGGRQCIQGDAVCTGEVVR